LKATLSEAFTYLVSARQRNFYARLVAGLIRVAKPGLGTMAVGVTKEGKYVLFYDPEWIAKLALTELMLTCEHEVYHLLLGHIPRYLNLISGLVDEEEKRKFRSVMNIAADCAANELMRSEQGFDKKFGEYFYGSKATEDRSFLIPETFDMEREQPFEVYQFTLLGRLKKTVQKLAEGLNMTTLSVPVQSSSGQGGAQGPQDQQAGPGPQGQQNQSGSGNGQQSGNGGGQQPHAILDQYFNDKTGGAHQFWEQAVEGLTDDEKQGLADKLQNELRQLVQQAVRGQSKSRGTMPAGVADLIEAILAPPKIPWPQVLRSLVTRTRQTKIGRGMSRPSRRMHGVPGILPFPGKARDRKFTVAFAIDTSGSMSEDELALALTELLNIAKTEDDVHIWVMYCDAALHITYEVTAVSDVDFNVLGRGGTDFNPPFIKVRELLKSGTGPDILIYATDGEAPAPRHENRVPIPVIWLLTPGATQPSPGYGHHIEMEPL
jgi:predicted metal-dependent peptidase